MTEELNIWNSEELRGYLDRSVNAWKTVREKSKMKAPPGHYFNLEDFVAQEGCAFGHISKRSHKYVQRAMKACFWNSRCVVSAARGNLTYVEGYCFSGLIPIHHAWACDQDGGVVDTTLPRGPAYAYLGIPFKIEYVKDITSSENCSVIDQWEHRWPLLMEPLDKNRHAVAA